jgi:nucleotide-binding universal stress UspA family protein
VKLFFSYARPDRERADSLAQRLRQAGNEVWLDTELTGGQVWWDKILDQVRSCDALVVVVSQAYLRSQASMQERGYATMLGKAVLPVAVEQIRAELLPPDIARLQVIDYSQPSEMAAFELIGSVMKLPLPPPLPDPLPEPPPIPISYLSSIAGRLSRPDLTRDDQFAIVGILEEALGSSDPSDRAVALQLLGEMEGRNDLLAAVDRRIAILLKNVRQATEPSQSAVSAGAMGGSRVAPARRPPGAHVKLFFSYARPDRERADSLAQRLRQAGNEVWLDTELTGGQVWWDKILDQVRSCDALVMIVSRASIKSEACMHERGYATMLGKAVLPVAVEQIRAELLPPDIARLQVIDYSQPSETAAFALIGSVMNLPPPPPLPRPLPARPSLPISSLASIADRLSRPNLTRHDQFAIVGILEEALGSSDPSDRASALQLLAEMEGRTDLLAAVDNRIATLKKTRQATGISLDRGSAADTGSAPDTGTGLWRQDQPKQERQPPPPPVAMDDEASSGTEEAQAKRETGAQASQSGQSKIFLCYRREDTQGFARSIYESLAGKYGDEQVFRDIDSTPAGVRFSAWIESRVGQCSVMVVLIGNAWLSAKDRAGQRRLDLPNDWVRQEIEAALSRDIPILPVQVQGAPMPSEDELPPSIADLAGFQSAEVTDRRWKYDVEQLTGAIDNLIAPDEGT